MSLFLDILQLLLAATSLIVFTRLWSGSLFVTKEYEGFTTQLISFDKSSSLNNVLFWLLLAPIYSVFVYICFVWLGIESNIIWVVTPMYWLLIVGWVAILGRIKLLNLPFVILTGVLGTAINFVISHYLFTGDLSGLMPSVDDVVAQLWLIVLLFFISILLKLSSDSPGDNRRMRSYFESKASSFVDEYPGINDCTDEVKLVVLAILIKEDFERPPTYRLFEGLTGAKTRNVAQNQSSSNKESVAKLISKITDLQQEFNERNENDEYFYDFCSYAAQRYNENNEYVRDINRIYMTLKELGAL